MHLNTEPASKRGPPHLLVSTFAGSQPSKAGKARTASDRAPYVSMNSEAGVLSLELLKQKLLREEGA
eukprot:1160006-Pelagomonas_calceolata.AAC.12